MARYWISGHAQQLFEALQRQQNSSQFCDTILETEGICVPAHSCILAAFSPYLSQQLSATSSLPSSQKRQLQLHPLKAQTVLNLVRLLYCGCMDVNGGVERTDVLMAAQHFGIWNLVEGHRHGATTMGRQQGRRYRSGSRRDAEVQTEPSSDRRWVSTGVQTVDAGVSTHCRCPSTAKSRDISVPFTADAHVPFNSPLSVGSSGMSSDTETTPILYSLLPRDTLSPCEGMSSMRVHQLSSKDNRQAGSLDKRSAQVKYRTTDKRTTGNRQKRQTSENADVSGSTGGDKRSVKNLCKRPHMQESIDTTQISIKVKLRRTEQFWEVVTLRDPNEMLSVITSMAQDASNTHNNSGINVQPTTSSSIATKSTTHAPQAGASGATKPLPYSNTALPGRQLVGGASGTPKVHPFNNTTPSSHQPVGGASLCQYPNICQILGPPQPPGEDADELIDRMLEDIMMGLNILPNIDSNKAEHHHLSYNGTVYTVGRASIDMCPIPVSGLATDMCPVPVSGPSTKMCPVPVGGASNGMCPVPVGRASTGMCSVPVGGASNGMCSVPVAGASNGMCPVPVGRAKHDVKAQDKSQRSHSAANKAVLCGIGALSCPGSTGLPSAQLDQPGAMQQNSSPCQFSSRSTGRRNGCQSSLLPNLQTQAVASTSSCKELISPQDPPGVEFYALVDGHQVQNLKPFSISDFQLPQCFSPLNQNFRNPANCNNQIQVQSSSLQCRPWLMNNPGSINKCSTADDDVAPTVKKQWHRSFPQDHTSSVMVYEDENPMDGTQRQINFGICSVSMSSNNVLAKERERLVSYLKTPSAHVEKPNQQLAVPVSEEIRGQLEVTDKTEINPWGRLKRVEETSIQATPGNSAQTRILQKTYHGRSQKRAMNDMTPVDIGTSNMGESSHRQEREKTQPQKEGRGDRKKKSSGSAEATVEEWSRASKRPPIISLKDFQVLRQKHFKKINECVGETEGEGRACSTTDEESTQEMENNKECHPHVSGSACGQRMHKWSEDSNRPLENTGRPLDNTGRSSQDSTGRSSQDSTDRSSQDSTGRSSQDSTGRSSGDNIGRSSRDNIGRSSRDNIDRSSRDNIGRASRDKIGRPLDNTSRPLDSSGRPLDSTNTSADSTGTSADSTGTSADSTGRLLINTGRSSNDRTRLLLELNKDEGGFPSAILESEVDSSTADMHYAPKTSSREEMVIVRRSDETIAIVGDCDSAQRTPDIGRNPQQNTGKTHLWRWGIGRTWVSDVEVDEEEEEVEVEVDEDEDEVEGKVDENQVDEEEVVVELDLDEENVEVDVDMMEEKEDEDKVEKEDEVVDILFLSPDKHPQCHVNIVEISPSEEDEEDVDVTGDETE